MLIASIDNLKKEANIIGAIKWGYVAQKSIGKLNIKYNNKSKEFDFIRTEFGEKITWTMLAHKARIDNDMDAIVGNLNKNWGNQFKFILDKKAYERFPDVYLRLPNLDIDFKLEFDPKKFVEYGVFK